jgi:glycosyltransferase involved in cell wall biosynthesis
MSLGTQMKIAQIISTPPFAWATGGSARVVYDLSRELANRGHNVTIITTDLYTPYQRYPSDLEVSGSEKITILRFPYFSDWLAWKKKIYISVDLINYIRVHIGEYDIVHLQDLISIQAVFAAKYCKKKKIPYVLSTHGSLPWLKRPGLAAFLFRFCFGKQILENATIITVLNEYEKQTCQSFGISEEKIIVLHNFLDGDCYTVLPEKNEFRQKFGIKNNEKILLYVGRIEQTKGLDLLIKVFADITKHQHNLKLVIIGNDDGYLEEISLLINTLKITDKVAIIGYVDEKDKISAYVDADIMIYPRNWEPFGLTILEACACGTPVICSTRCGIADYINNTAGLTFTYNSESLKKAITELLDNSELHEKLSIGGKQLITEHFTPKKIVDTVETIYEKVNSNHA